jgi:hypothetical protein
MNPHITWEIVQSNPDKPWDYVVLDENPNITREIILTNPDKPWNYDDKPIIMWNPETFEE